MHPRMVEERVSAIEQVCATLKIAMFLGGQFVFCPVDVLEKVVAIACTCVSSQTERRTKIERDVLHKVHSYEEIARPNIETMFLTMEELTLQMLGNVEWHNGEYVVV